jgi:prevent-host-death family protein
VTILVTMRAVSKPIQQMAAGEFKAKCLKIMDEVQASGVSLVITKHGRPIARLGPVVERPATLVGFMRGEGKITGDIVAPTGEAWDAEQ